MRTLVLDIGGVFYLSKADDAFFARWAERAGRTAEALAASFWHGPDIEAANVGRIDAEAYFQRAGARLNLDPALIAEMVRDAFVGDFNHAFARYVRDLRERGAAVCALTNSWSSEADLMARPELAGLFDFAVSSHDAGVAKPDPAIYRLMIARVGRAAEAIVFVDDTLVCVEAARALGLHAVHFRDTAQAIAALAPLLG